MGPSWNGQPLVLQLEHKNGINNDNRLENLAFICPNCHSQTPTYAGRNSVGMRKFTPEQKPNVRRDKLDADRKKLAEAKAVLDLTAWGWRTRLAEFVGVSPQKINKWLARVDPEWQGQ